VTVPPSSPFQKEISVSSDYQAFCVLGVRYQVLGIVGYLLYLGTDLV
jgi:hypothetical protein